MRWAKQSLSRAFQQWRDATRRDSKVNLQERAARYFLNAAKARAFANWRAVAQWLTLEDQRMNKWHDEHERRVGDINKALADALARNKKLEEDMKNKNPEVVTEVQVVQQPPDEAELRRLRKRIEDLEDEGDGKAEIARLNARIKELLELLKQKEEDDARRRQEEERRREEDAHRRKRNDDGEEAWRQKYDDERRRAEEERRRAQEERLKAEEAARKLKEANDRLALAEKLRRERDEAKRRADDEEVEKLNEMRERKRLERELRELQDRQAKTKAALDAAKQKEEDLKKAAQVDDSKDDHIKDRIRTWMMPKWQDNKKSRGFNKWRDVAAICLRQERHVRRVTAKWRKDQQVHALQNWRSYAENRKLKILEEDARQMELQTFLVKERQSQSPRSRRSPRSTAS